MVKGTPLEVMPGAQLDFVLSEAKFPSLLGGVGSGKTIGCVVKGFVKALNNPKSRGCLTAATYTQVWDILMPAIREKFGDTEGRLWEVRRGPPPEIRFVNGSLILLRPALEPDRLRGLDLAWFGMDEAAVGDQEEAFVILLARLRQKGFAHQGWVTTTPHWRRAWIRKTWQDKRNPTTGGPLPAADYPIFLASTEDNRYLRPDFVSDIRARAGSERSLRQELYGEFIDVEGVAFPMFSERTHVRTPPENIEVVRRVIGVDPGGTAPTAVEEFVLLANGDIQGTYEFYERDSSDKALVEAISSRPRCKVVVDSAMARTIEQMRRYGINAHGARIKSFEDRKRLWTGRLNLVNRNSGKVYRPGEPGAEYAKPGIYLSPKQPNLIAELGNLAHASIRGTEQLVDKWEQGLDDHAYDAGAYCLADLDPAQMRVEPLKVSGMGFP